MNLNLALTREAYETWLADPATEAVYCYFRDRVAQMEELDREDRWEDGGEGVTEKERAYGIAVRDVMETTYAAIESFYTEEEDDQQDT